MSSPGDSNNNNSSSSNTNKPTAAPPPNEDIFDVFKRFTDTHISSFLHSLIGIPSTITRPDPANWIIEEEPPPRPRATSTTEEVRKLQSERKDNEDEGDGSRGSSGGMSGGASFGEGRGGSGSAGSGNTGAPSSSSSAYLVQDTDQPSRQPQMCFHDNNDPSKKICFALDPFFKALENLVTTEQIPDAYPERDAAMLQTLMNMFTMAPIRDLEQAARLFDEFSRFGFPDETWEKDGGSEYTRPAHHMPTASEWQQKLARAQSKADEGSTGLPKTELDMYEQFRTMANAQNPNTSVPSRDQDQTLPKIISREKQTRSVTGPDGVTHSNEVVVIRYSDGSEKRYTKENTDSSKSTSWDMVSGARGTGTGAREEVEGSSSKPSVFEEINKTKAAAGEGWFWSASK